MKLTKKQQIAIGIAAMQHAVRARVELATDAQWSKAAR